MTASIMLRYNHENSLKEFWPSHTIGVAGDDIMYHILVYIVFRPQILLNFLHGTLLL